MSLEAVADPKASSPGLKGAFLHEEAGWGDQPLLAEIHSFKSSLNVGGFFWFGFVFWGFLGFFCFWGFFGVFFFLWNGV